MQYVERKAVVVNGTPRYFERVAGSTVVTLCKPQTLKETKIQCTPTALYACPKHNALQDSAALPERSVSRRSQISTAMRYNPPCNLRRISDA